MPTVNNHDIAGVARRVNRFIDEIQKAVSSEASQVNAFDLERFKSYLNAIDTYHTWVVSQPALDLPETHPRAIQVVAGPELIALENESLTDLVYLLAIARDELLNSQSARNGSGLISFDSKRLTGVVQKAGALLETYVETVTPLDFLSHLRCTLALLLARLASKLMLHCEFTQNSR